jgi:hypothetical protein
MSTVSLTVRQDHVNNSYSPGTCNCFTCPQQPTTCPNGDWQYATGQCCGELCPSIPLCSQLDPSVCPVMAGGAISKNWQTPNSTNSSGANVNCQYRVSGFTSLSDVQTWINSQGMDAQYQTQIMPSFCAGASTTCPVDWATGLTMSTCNRLLSTGEDGTLCRQWQKQNPTLADNAMTQYCTNAKNKFGCDCVNRGLNPGYPIAKPNFTANDACWWRPCQFPTQELVPSSLLNPVCPANTCQDASNITPQQQTIVSQKFISCPLPTSPVHSVAQTLGINVGSIAPALGITPASPIARSPAGQRIARAVGLQQTSTSTSAAWKGIVAILIALIVIVLIVMILMNATWF